MYILLHTKRRCEGVCACLSVCRREREKEDEAYPSSLKKAFVQTNLDMKYYVERAFRRSVCTFRLLQSVVGPLRRQELMMPRINISFLSVDAMERKENSALGLHNIKLN